ncbi:MAG: Hsp70 family protein [Microcystis panniformis]
MLRLGIDFGTCYSSAALLLEGVPTPIPAPLTPGYALPSSVFITEQGEILVGQAAENKRQKNPQRYRREFKRDLGSPDPYTLGNVSMLPEELVAAVLKKLKEEAEKVALGRGEKFLTNALITVPATYSSYKRNLMQDAGRKAGFSQIEMLEEPVAAARYYSCHAQINDGDIILVYDLGGGTFDATLMQKQGDNYQVLAMPKGLANCGGTDFDHLIYQQLKLQCSNELRQQLEPKEAWLARAIVGDFCRDLKHQLSEQTEASIYIPMGLGNVETFELTREVFNAMIAPLIEETLDCCEQLVRSAKKDWTQVNQMLLVGGSSRIPYVKEAIERRFNISPFLIDKPELAVCLGATIKNSIPDPIPELIPSAQDIIKTHINLGDNLYQQGKLEEAITEYKEVIRLEPYNVEANHRLQLAEQSLHERLEAERQQRQREQETIEAEIRKIEAEIKRREQLEKYEAEIRAEAERKRIEEKQEKLKIVEPISPSSEECISIEIPTTMGFGGGTLNFYNDAVESKGIKLLYKNILSISYSCTKTSVNFIPTNTTYTYILKSQADKISYIFQAAFNIGNKNRQDIFSRIIYVSKQMIEPILIQRYVNAIFNNDEQIKICSLVISKRGMQTKGLFKGVQEILWTEKIYTPEIHEGSVYIYKDTNGKPKVFASMMLGGDNAPIVPELVIACHQMAQKSAHPIL